MKDIAPRKSLGQNFLKNKTVAMRIVDLLGDVSGKPVLEIGPGMGVLTEFLTERNPLLTLVELDERAIDYLRNKFNRYLNIVHSDILDFDIKRHSEQYKEKLLVIGNIPYNISTEIFFLLFENAACISKAVLTVQKEVAVRVCSGYGSRQYGITSVAARLVCTPSIAFDIAAGSFFPAPKVTSSVLVLDFYQEHKYLNDFAEIMSLVRAAFSQRRKMLRNSLENYLKACNLPPKLLEDELNKNDLRYFSMRAEQLSLQDFVKLFEIISSLKKNK